MFMNNPASIVSSDLAYCNMLEISAVAATVLIEDEILGMTIQMGLTYSSQAKIAMANELDEWRYVMGQIVLLRHGESQWNLENRFTGWVDVPLSPKGEEEARSAGLKLKAYRFDRAFTSVLIRANETLRLVLETI